MLGFSACDDDNDWEPGEAENADSPAVYFSKDNASTFEFETDNHKFDLTIKRLKTSDAITVPLKSTVGNENIIIPSSVTFAAGQEEAVITVDCTNIPVKEVFDIKIEIPEEYCTKYAQGFDVYSGTVAIVEWVVLDPNFKYTYYDSSNNKVYNPTYGELQMLEGMNKYRLTNFMNSGKNFTFALDATQSGCSSTYIGVKPLDNYVYDISNGSYGCWYFHDDTNDIYPSWTMADGEPVYYFYAYGVGYSYFNLNDSYGCFSAYFVPDENQDEWNWTYVWCYFSIPEEYQGKLLYTK